MARKKKPAEDKPKPVQGKTRPASEFQKVSGKACYVDTQSGEIISRRMRDRLVSGYTREEQVDLNKDKRERFLKLSHRHLVVDSGYSGSLEDLSRNQKYKELEDRFIRRGAVKKPDRKFPFTDPEFEDVLGLTGAQEYFIDTGDTPAA
jgi:hypothetical protein